MQFLGYPTRGQKFWQGQIGTAPKIAQVEVELKPAQSRNFFNLNTWLPANLKSKTRAYEANYRLTMENPYLYVSKCITSREVPGVAKELCKIYVFPVFASTTEENYVCDFSVNFEVTESSIRRYQFVLVDPLAEQNWLSQELVVGAESLV